MSFAHLADLVQEMRPLAERFTAAGWRVYLVGGIVRDLYLDRPVSDDADIDLTTDATPGDVRKVLNGWAHAIWDQGERFGTVGARRNERRYEITTHRTEQYQPGSRKPAVTFSTAIQEDLSRRDFTVNAMALELPGGNPENDLVDPFDGIGDLERKLLRTPLDPETTFSDDPLRMLRAARFATRYDLTPVAGLLEAVHAMGERLGIVSAERIRDELRRLLESPDPAPGVAMLLDCDLLGLAVHPALEEDPWLLHALGRVGEDPLARLAVLLTAIGSLAEITDTLKGLRFPRAVVQEVSAILKAAWLALPEDLDEQVPDTPTLRGWLLDTGPHAHKALQVVTAMHPSFGTAFTAAAQQLAAAEPDLSTSEPLLDGVQIMALLGAKPGPQVGAAQAELRRLRLQQGPMTVEEASDHLLRWQREQQQPS